MPRKHWGEGGLGEAAVLGLATVLAASLVVGGALAVVVGVLTAAGSGGCATRRR